MLCLLLIGLNFQPARAQVIHTITVRKKVEDSSSLLSPNTRFLPSSSRFLPTKEEQRRRQKLHLSELYPDSNKLNSLRDLRKTEISYEIRLITLYKNQPPRFWEKLDPEFKLEELPDLGTRSTDSLLLVEYAQVLGRSRTGERIYLQPFAVQTYGRARWQKLKLKDIYQTQSGVSPIPAKHEIVRYKLVLKNAKDEIVYQTNYPSDEFDAAIIPDFVTKVEFVDIEALKPLPKNKMKERSILLSDLSIDAETLRRR